MMQEKVFFDTNIVLDMLGKREPFFQSAEKVFKLGETGKMELQISSLTFINVQYILRKQIGKEPTKKVIRSLRLLCTICNTGEREIDLALLSEMEDFEDAVQYFTAINNNSKVIITRNGNDFRGSQIPIMTAEEYLNSLEDIDM